MKNLLILWSLPKKIKDKTKYQNIIKACKPFFDEIYSPLDTVEFVWTDQERFDRALFLLKKCDFILWEQSIPSTWQWLEIGIAFWLNKPLLVIAEEWSQVSWLTLWLPILKEIYYYKSRKDLEKFLKNYFEKWK